MRVLKFLQQRAVYWEPLPAGETGQEGYADPVEIRCRWEDVQEVQAEPGGEQWMSAARIMVDRVVLTDGYLWRSSKTTRDPEGSALAELTTPANPVGNPGAAKIRKVTQVPDLHVTEAGTVRTAYL